MTDVCMVARFLMRRKVTLLLLVWYRDWEMQDFVSVPFVPHHTPLSFCEDEDVA